LSLYGGLAVLLGSIVYRERKWKLGLGAALGVTAFAVLSVLTVPSLQNKLDYMVYDLSLFGTTVAEDYSDNLRITSMRLGGEIFLENPLFGVGIGDVKDEMHRKYETKTPEIGRDRWFAPVSQIFSWLASFGLVGTVLIFGFLLYPILKHGRKSYLLVAAFGCALASMPAETMFRAIETKAVILIVICLTYEFVKDSVKEESLEVSPHTEV
jgi:O-antigen ligase